jgi:hypothetical protein
VPIPLPDPVPGDPAGMRALAGALRGDAATMAIVASQVDSRMKETQFVGPAADRLRGTIGDYETRCVRLGQQLVDVAALLERAATDVEAAQRARQREIEHILATRTATGVPR